MPSSQRDIELREDPRLGYEARARYSGRTFDSLDADLARDYESRRGKSKLEWNRAKHASRAAWDRIERAIPGDLDKDGK